jgi:hypothetical protein
MEGVENISKMVGTSTFDSFMRPLASGYACLLWRSKEMETILYKNHPLVRLNKRAFVYQDQGQLT